MSFFLFTLKNYFFSLFTKRMSLSRYVIEYEDRPRFIQLLASVSNCVKLQIERKFSGIRKCHQKKRIFFKLSS